MVMVMVMGRRAAAVAAMEKQWPSEALGCFPLALGDSNTRLCGRCCCRRRRAIAGAGADFGAGARRAGWPKPAAAILTLLRVE